MASSHAGRPLELESQVVAKGSSALRARGSLLFHCMNMHERYMGFTTLAVPLICMAAVVQARLAMSLLMSRLPSLHVHSYSNAVDSG